MSVFVFASERYSLVAGDRGAHVSDLHGLQLSDVLWIYIFLRLRFSKDCSCQMCSECICQRLRFSMGCTCHLLINFYGDLKLELKDILFAYASQSLFGTVLCICICMYLLYHPMLDCANASPSLQTNGGGRFYVHFRSKWGVSVCRATRLRFGQLWLLTF